MKLIVFLVLFSVSFSLACLNCRRRKTCEDDTWTLINRTLGGWCVKLIPSYYNMSMAEETCSDVGAVLSSVESDTELAVESNLMSEQNITAAFVGSQLKPECACSNFTVYSYLCPFNSTSTCTLYNAFVWTDNFTVGDSMMSELYPNMTITYYFEYVVINAGILITTSDARASLLQQYYVFGALCGKKAT